MIARKIQVLKQKQQQNQDLLNDAFKQINALQDIIKEKELSNHHNKEEIMNVIMNIEKKLLTITEDTNHQNQ